MLRVDKLRVPGLQPMSFSLAFGECIAVDGPSGAGKTRTLRAIADLDPCEGYLFLAGGERREIPGPRWRQQVRYVASEPAWWAETPRAHFDPKGFAADATRLNRALVTIGLQPEVFDEPIARLSTGQRLRLSHLRALDGDPKVLLFDEPTAQLDQTNAALVEEFIRFHILSNRGVILVSHDRGLMHRLARKRLLLADGRPRMEAL